MKLVIVAAAFSIGAAPPAAAPQPAAPAQAATPARPAAPVRPAAPATADGFATTARNIHHDRPGCVSIRRQVQEESKRAETRRGESRTLGEEPSAHLFAAVDRQVAGCREVTFLRRDIAPGPTTPELGRERR
jgi:hypothetical protein